MKRYRIQCKYDVICVAISEVNMTKLLLLGHFSNERHKPSLKLYDAV